MRRACVKQALIPAREGRGFFYHLKLVVGPKLCNSPNKASPEDRQDAYPPNSTLRMLNSYPFFGNCFPKIQPGMEKLLSWF
jgi:hypothetical protein